MSNDLVAILLSTSALASAALLIVLLLRRPLRAAFGARVAYTLWGLPLLAISVAWLPPPAHTIDDPMLEVLVARPLQAIGDVPVAASASTLWLAIWLLGVVAMAIRVGWQHRRFVRALGPVREAGDGLFQASTCDGLPALVGVVRARIVLPADFAARYAADQQRLVIAHEREHLRRGDHLGNLIGAIVHCLYWFNPLLLVAMPLFARDQELACDAAVIAAHPNQRRCYAETLLDSLCQRGRMPLVLAFGSHPLKERISMIQHHLLSKSRIRVGRFILLLVAAVVTTAAWAMQPQSSPTAIPVADAGAAEVVSYRTRVPPVYPEASVQAKEQGTVVLKVRVLADGTPSDIAIEKSTATPALEQAAIDAVQRWLFNPAMQDGKAVEGTVLVPVMFSPDEDAVPEPQALPGVWVRPATVGGP